ncbi:hypothetical protein FQV43_02410 [Corynebacterium sp. sy039]|nr:hypothetical protein FQV43_02410 [Corynebacterium sp. sy039]
MIKLSPHARVFLRPGGAIQFGMNAYHAGIIQCEPQIISAVLAAFLELRAPTITQQFITRLVQAGLGELAARTMVEELIAHGIIWHHQPTTVALIGNSRSAAIVHEVLNESDIAARVPMRNESPRLFIQRLEAHIPIIVVGQQPMGALTQALARRRSVIPARIIDTHCVIGPVKLSGSGPCLHCIELYCIDADPHWTALLEQCSPSQRYAPAYEHLLAAKLTGLLTATFHGATHNARMSPTITAPVLSAGTVVSFDLYTANMHHEQRHSHPLCVYCYEQRQHTSTTR